MTIIRFGMTPSHRSPHPGHALNVHHATASTVGDTAIPHVNSHTGATDAGEDTQVRDATNIHHLDTDLDGIKINPLPSRIIPTVNISVIRALVSDFPDKNFCKYILDGITFGFKTGFSGVVTETRPKNLLSARNNENKVTAAILKEIQRKHTSGPFRTSPFKKLHCSPIGAADKPDGSIRLVLDLSQPEGLSINEHINKEVFLGDNSPFKNVPLLNILL